MKTLIPLSISSLLIFISLFSASTNAATFTIRNNCRYTVWAAALPGGGQRLDPGRTWALNVNRGTGLGRIWARTNCSFDNHNHGTCLTGDCNNRFTCTTNGAAPRTTAEFSLAANRDTYRISLIDGFNVPMEFRPENSCPSVRCNPRNLLGECPNDFKRPGGCINPCRVGNCGSTQMTRFFKQRCPNAYAFDSDYASSFSCAGPNYSVIFCP